MTSHDTTSFEDERWRTFAQSREFRHVAALDLIQGGSVLDIGCGDGFMLSLLKEAGVTAEGADISPIAVARCKERGLNARTYNPGEKLPYNDASFTTVLLLDVLEHVYMPEALLKEATRIASKEVIVSVPNFSSLPARLQMIRGLPPENNRPGKGHVYWFTKAALDEAVQHAGLQYAELRMNTVGILLRLGIPVWLWPEGLALSFVAKLVKGIGN